MPILAISALIESKQKCEIGIFKRQILSRICHALHRYLGGVHKIFLCGAITFDWLYLLWKPIAIELFFFKNTLLFFARENLHVRLLIYLVALPKNFAFKFIFEFSSKLFRKVFFFAQKVKSAMAQICRRAFLHRLRQKICGFGIL